MAQLTILLHSSKTMRNPTPGKLVPTQPALLDAARQLDAYLKTRTSAELATIMHISMPLAEKTRTLIAGWGTAPARQSLAIDSFVGDIYSGLRAEDLSVADRNYANDTLHILSGLYGILRPYDGIRPYRLEMGYKLPGAPQPNLYQFWGERIAACIPSSGTIVNVSSVEYSRTITPFVDVARIITPQFLTRDPRSGEPAFVVVHAKIARGAFARWLITSRVTNPADFTAFADIGYRLDTTLSTAASPAFVCDTFGGIGLSMRLR